MARLFTKLLKDMETTELDKKFAQRFQQQGKQQGTHPVIGRNGGIHFIPTGETLESFEKKSGRRLF